jgi:Tfp pilus assembly ATPase PilU
MYQMDQLLNLLTAEKAKVLQFRAGSPPIMLSERERHLLQGPPITDEEVLTLFRSVASSREMRELRELGKLHFVYTAPGRAPFVIQAKMHAESIAFEVS